MWKVTSKNPLNLKLFIGHGKNSKIRICSAFNKAVGPGKNPKLINVGPTFILNYRILFSEHTYAVLEHAYAVLKHVYAVLEPRHVTKRDVLLLATIQ